MSVLLMKKKISSILNRIIMFILVFAVVIVSISATGCGTVTVKASSADYDSWMNGWNTGDTYNGVTSFTTDSEFVETGEEDWLTSTAIGFLSLLVRATVAPLLLLLSDSMDASIENVVYGRVGTGSTNYFQFGLEDGNIYGSIAAILYSIFRNAIFLFFAIQFVLLFLNYLLRGTGKGRSDLKSKVYDFVFMFVLLYAVPVIVDLALFIRDAILRIIVEETSSISGSYALGVTDAILINTNDDWTLVGAILLCCVCGAGIYFLVDYLKRAVQQIYLFGVFPIVAYRSFSDKQILNKWVGHFITSLFVPLFDAIGLWLVVLIQDYHANAAGDGPAVLGLIIYMSIIPCRNMVMQLFGMPMPNKGFGLMTAAMMLARGFGGKGKGKDDSGKGDDRNKPADANGSGDTIKNENSNSSSSGSSNGTFNDSSISNSDTQGGTHEGFDNANEDIGASSSSDSGDISGEQSGGEYESGAGSETPAVYDTPDAFEPEGGDYSVEGPEGGNYPVEGPAGADLQADSLDTHVPGDFVEQPAEKINNPERELDDISDNLQTADGLNSEDDFKQEVEQESGEPIERPENTLGDTMENEPENGKDDGIRSTEEGQYNTATDTNNGGETTSDDAIKQDASADAMINSATEPTNSVADTSTVPVGMNKAVEDASNNTNTVPGAGAKTADNASRTSAGSSDKSNSQDKVNKVTPEMSTATPKSVKEADDLEGGEKSKIQSGDTASLRNEIRKITDANGGLPGGELTPEAKLAKAESKLARAEAKQARLANRSEVTKQADPTASGRDRNNGETSMSEHIANGVRGAGMVAGGLAAVAGGAIMATSGDANQVAAGAMIGKSLGSAAGNKLAGGVGSLAGTAEQKIKEAAAENNAKKIEKLKAEVAERKAATQKNEMQKGQQGTQQGAEENTRTANRANVDNKFESKVQARSDIQDAMERIYGATDEAPTPAVDKSDINTPKQQAKKKEEEAE